ncbi:haloacid dehalogenase superfamily protein, subfamily IA, variant 3 with third motif having DD or ED [Rhizobium leguminosarum bv. viciae WSM1455]|uniref:HAD family hydrolase n=1 Tax=Rhizobium acaciae TaxID=2989736 RepID=UPI00027D695A|nr:HAD family hydrolase [Rhizobium acaciae]EJC65980.1 haloacid dehalogenase superfamily protein, subfamily IA, variant 3 with third motif having DD or ED [Rhizobium leguminosarum bv. viciae WSM1455]MCW1749040.1 HAD family hydrolase [Rhizobium acaciae]
MSLPMPRGFEKPYAAFLFDMDGTILNSIRAAERVWSDWARRHGLDVATFLPKMHGSRGIDTITRLNLPGVDPEHESKLVTEAEIADVSDVVAIPGAATFLSSLPPDRWAIVTSSPLRLAHRRLEAAGLPVPKFMVTAEDVKVGKPDPQCYILGAERLGVSTQDCLVFEDVAAGITAGEAAGADVMVITATHHQKMETPHPTLSSYDEISVRISSDHRMLIVPNAA